MRKNSTLIKSWYSSIQRQMQPPTWPTFLITVTKYMVDAT